MPPVQSPSVVHTGKDGSFVSDAAREAVDSIFTGPAADAEKLVFYFHGGLDNAATGMKIADKLDPVFKSAGAHPVFFVWESGLFEVLTHNISEIAGEDIFKILLKVVTKFSVAKLGDVFGTKGVSALALPSDMSVYEELARLDVGEEPYAHFQPSTTTEVTSEEAELLKQELSQNPDFQATIAAIAASVLPEPVVRDSRGIEVRIRSAGRTLMSPHIVEDIEYEAETEGAKGLFISPSILIRAAKVFTRVVKRFMSKRDHGLYPTIVEELMRELYLDNVGMAIWGAMKGETADTFKPADPARGGEYTMKKLGLLIAQKPREVTLVGHSTGAVFINNLLAYTQSMRAAGTLPKDFAFKNIIFLAPACTYNAFYPYVKAPYVAPTGPLYDTFRLFAMSDSAECQDHLVPFVYTRSLLYFVSGILEPSETGASYPDMPVVGMQRFNKQTDVYTDDVIKNIRTYMTDDRVVWSPVQDPRPGYSSTAVHHGGFADDPVTRESMVAMIKGQAT